MLDNVPQARFIERTRCVNCDSPTVKELSHGRYADAPLKGFLDSDAWGEDPMPYLRSATWTLAQCTSCTQVFHKTVLDEEWNDRKFSQWMSADAIQKFMATKGPAFPRQFGGALHYAEHVVRLEHLTKDLRGGGPVRLLDFGCGRGSFVALCRQFNFDACGIDRSSERRSSALVEIYPSLAEVEDQQFHVITLFEVLEHIDQPADILRALVPFLVDGGVLVLETPDCSGVTNIRTHRDYHLVHPLEHINAFTHDTLKSIAERSGFTLIDRPAAVVTADPLKAVKRIAKHGLRRDGRSTQLYFRKM